MRYLALATDYDGTIAHHGRVDGETLAALERLKSSGRKLILVTGRELDDLIRVFPEIGMFEWVVAENGALLYQPSSREEKLLAPAPPAEFVLALKERGVGPIGVGRSIVATWEPHEVTVLQTIRDMALELQVIFNKGAVMVLPAGVNKATGLSAALHEMGLSRHNVVGVGDAENDHAFLRECECSVAVANALATVKETADLVTRGDHGRGVTELIDDIVSDDLGRWDDQIVRHRILLGVDEQGHEVRLGSYGTKLLIAGPSSSGKSTVATSFLERLVEQHYQFCVIDPEGDYETLEEVATLGSSERAPLVKEVAHMLSKPDENVVVNLLGLSLQERPDFLLSLTPHLESLRTRTGRPHWLIIDEAHHLLPRDRKFDDIAFIRAGNSVAMITVHAELMAPAALKSIDTVIAVGDSPDETIAGFCSVAGVTLPSMTESKLETGDVLLWRRGAGVTTVRVTPGRTDRRRHRRKYAEGELPSDRSFYFRGSAGKLNLRARNLINFIELAEGVDDDTWLFHCREGDYSRWFREGIKDENLARVAEHVEQSRLPADEGRALIKAAIERDYTLPASANKSPAPRTSDE